MTELWRDYTYPFEFIGHANDVVSSGGTLPYDFWSRAADVMIAELDVPGTAIFYSGAENFQSWGGTGSNNVNVFDNTNFGKFFSIYDESYAQAVSDHLKIDIEPASIIATGIDKSNHASIWARASDAFSNAASGETYVLLGQDATVDRTFGQIELPNLLSSDSSVKRWS